MPVPAVIDGRILPVEAFELRVAEAKLTVASMGSWLARIVAARLTRAGELSLHNPDTYARALESGRVPRHRSTNGR